jgi:hypothetical protein
LTSPPSAISGFFTLTITLVQGGCSVSCDNWDLQGINVTVFNSAGLLPRTTLLNLSDPRDGDNCVARLKTPPNATAVRFSLDGTNQHVYLDGTESSMTTSCKNNGDGG